MRGTLDGGHSAMIYPDKKGRGWRWRIGFTDGSWNSGYADMPQTREEAIIALDKFLAWFDR